MLQTIEFASTGSGSKVEEFVTLFENNISNNLDYVMTFSERLCSDATTERYVCCKYVRCYDMTDAQIDQIEEYLGHGVSIKLNNNATDILSSMRELIASLPSTTLHKKAILDYADRLNVIVRDI